MKHLSSVLSLFGLLGSTLILPQNVVFSQSAVPSLSNLNNSLNQSISTASVPQQRQVQVRVELLDVNNLDQQEFFGADEVFALWVFSAMRQGPYDLRPYRAETHFGVSQPVSLKIGQRKTIPAGTLVFDGVLPEGGALSGVLRAMEEDETRKWSDTFREAQIAEVLDRIHTEKNMRENTVNSDSRPATNADLAKWAAYWWNQSVSRPQVGPFTDVDDIIATMPLEISATGVGSEERSWRAEGDGAVYELRYRITRTPISPPTPQSNPQSLPQFPTPSVPTPPTIDLSTWADGWQTTYGRVNLVLENGVLRGQLFLTNVDGSDRPFDHLELRAGSTPGQLVGTSTTRSLVTQVTMTLSADGESFTATGQLPGQALYKWGGKRQRLIPKTSTAPASTPTLPVTETSINQSEVPTQSSSPAPPLVPTAPTNSADISSRFLPMRSFGVRIDRVQPGITGDKLEVYCTFKNRTNQADNINSSMISAIVTDADGIGHLSDGTFSRPDGEAELMAGNREVTKQGELKVRLLVDIASGTSPLKTLTLWETSSQLQTFDISDIQWPQAKPATDLSKLKLNGGNAEFRACGEALDVRFDGFRKARSGSYEAFFTYKNTSEIRTRNSVLDLHRGSFEVFTLGDDGAKQLYRELARANGEQAIPIVSHYAILPGGEARLRYIISSQDDVPNPIKVGLTDRVSKTTLEWSVSSK